MNFSPERDDFEPFFCDFGCEAATWTPIGIIAFTRNGVAQERHLYKHTCVNEEYVYELASIQKAMPREASFSDVAQAMIRLAESG